ncbi:hypothetical protein Tco_0650165 [Tanacetum coccineum]
MLRLLLFFGSSHGWPSVVKWHAVVRGLRSLRNRGARTPCDCVRVMLFAELRSSCSLRLCTDYASCGAAGVWSLWAFPSVGLGPVAYSMVRGRGPDDAIQNDGLAVMVVVSGEPVIATMAVCALVEGEV